MPPSLPQDPIRAVPVVVLAPLRWSLLGAPLLRVPLLCVPLLWVPLVGCLATPIPTVDRIDLPQFMGDWYILAHIPAAGEEDAHNSVESYRLIDRRTVATTCRFRPGGFDADVETMELTGLVRNEATNATWAMRPIWPVDLEYLVTHVDPAYQTTIIARSRRDHVWIMARQPAIDEDRYDHLVGLVAEQGYDVDRLRRIPHKWPDDGIDVDEGVPLDAVPPGHGPLGVNRSALER